MITSDELEGILNQVGSGALSSKAAERRLVASGATVSRDNMT